MKQRAWIPTIVLIGVAALLIGFVVGIMPLLEKSPEEGSIPTPAPLWESTGASVTRITLRRGLRLTTVERDGTGWRVVDPLASEADSLRMDSVTYQALNMVASRTLEGDPATFGLTAENATQVVLTMSDGTTIEFFIGDENPNHTSRYVRKSGDSTIYLVPISYVADLVKMVDYPPYPATPIPPTPEPSPLETPTAEETATPTPKATASPTPKPTSTPKTTPTPTATPKP